MGAVTKLSMGPPWDFVAHLGVSRVPYSEPITSNALEQLARLPFCGTIGI